MRLLWQAVVLSLLCVPGWSTTLYSNGAINGTIAAATINEGSGREVSDSFVISSSATVTGVSNIGLWLSTGDGPPTNLNWVISTSPDGGGTVKGSGAASVGAGSLSSSFLGSHTTFWIYSASFSVSGVALTAGTYYLELFDGVPTDEEFVGWDENSGSSTADSNTYPTPGTPTTIPSESFEIDGNPNTPEPATAGTLAAGLGFLAWQYGRRKRA